MTKIVIAVFIILLLFLIFYGKAYLKINFDIQKKKQEKEKLDVQLSECHSEIGLAQKDYDRIVNESKLLQDNSINLQKMIEEQKENLGYKYKNLEDELQKEYFNLSSQITEEVKDKLKEVKTYQDKINVLKSAYLSRLKTAQLEQEAADLSDYKIILTPNDEEDVVYLWGLRAKVHRQDVLNKLIWKTYIERPANEMITRVLGTDPHCGIYKITNLENQKTYIGQSVNVRNRWLQHIKRGIGAETPTGSLLYASMASSYIWNFTFELIEECPSNLLNEREAFWIGFYDSKAQGLNSTVGNAT